MTKTINEVKIEKLVTVVGTIVGENETKQLHTSTCSCGKTMVRANKENSLKHYTENPKWTAQCCKSMLSYTGERFFKGKEIFTETPVISIPELATTPKVEEVKAPRAKKEKTTKRTGMTNTEMINAMKESIENSEALTTLFNENEELFIKMVQCIKDDFKYKVLPIIQTKYPNADIDRKNPKVKHVIGI